MQLEWNRFWNGIANFKENQGLLWLFCAVAIVYGLKKTSQEKRRWLIVSLILGALVLFPVTAVILLKFYTPFYGWDDLHQLVPFALLIGFGAVELYEFLVTKSIPGMSMSPVAKRMVSGLCIMVLLFAATNFHGFDGRLKAEKHGIPRENAEVFDALRQVTQDKQIVLAAPPEMLQYARLYEPSWRPIYGRDLWNGKAASYINSGYDWEWDYYILLEDEVLSEEECKDLVSVINEGKADCIIVPYLWMEIMDEMPGYDLLPLTSSYAGLIKKDLLKNE